MSTTNKETIAAGTDNRPPMLEESDFYSWKIQIQRYIRGKPNQNLIWNSIKNEPTLHPTTIDTMREGEQQTQVIRKKRDGEFIEAENIKELADIQAINILSQGLPKHIFNTLNQTETTREIGECRATYAWIRTFTNPMTQATIQAGQITTESVQRRAPGNKAKECKEKKQEKDSQWFKDKALLMEAKEKRVALDAKAEAFLSDVECTAHYDDSLAITTTTAFEVIHKDAYDSDVDEAPHAIY
nr:hypothetical protein [Tanacetum cinerariifolium]